MTHSVVQLSPSKSESTQCQTNQIYPEWRKLKASAEMALLNNLGTALRDNQLDAFEAALRDRLPLLEQLYAELNTNDSVKLPDRNTREVLKNRKLKKFFGDMCSKEGNGAFIRVFAQFLPFANEVIQQLQNQHPIHLAIQALAFKNAEELLNMSDLDVNALWKKQTPLMLLFKVFTSQNYDQIRRLVKLLATKCADVNLGDHKSHPLSVLVLAEKVERWRKRELLEFCLQNFDADVDSFYGGQPRKDIEAQFDDLNIIRKRAKVTVGLLNTFLVEGKEAEFLAMFDDYYKDANGKNNLEDVYELLRQAAIKGRDRCVGRVFTKLTFESQPFDPCLYPDRLARVLKIVCTKGYPKVLELFLKHIKDIQFLNADVLLTICVRNVGKRKNQGTIKCFDLLLSDRRIDVEKRDHLGQTALHFAVQLCLNEMALKIMVNRSPYLGQLNRFNTSPLHSMNPVVLQSYLDACISLRDLRSEDIGQEIHIDMRGFVPPEVKQQTIEYKKRRAKRSDLLSSDLLTRKVSKEIDCFRYIAQSRELRKLLRHPSISAFLFVKWLQLRYIIYAKLVLSIVFFISLSAYAMPTDANHQIIHTFCTFSFILYFFLRETVSILNLKLLYFRSFENCIEFTVSMLSLPCLVTSNKVLLSTVVLLSGIDIVCNIGSLPFPSLSTSIVMLETVSMNFLKNFLVYAVILVAFGFSFFILFVPDNSATRALDTEDAQCPADAFNGFNSLGMSLLKSIVMLTGEFEAASIDFSSNGASSILFISFVFLVSLVIANLINGLAVSDITEIRQEAELVALMKKVEILARYEQGDNRYKFFKGKVSFFASHEPTLIIRPRENNKILVNRCSARDQEEFRLTPSSAGRKTIGLKAFRKWPLSSWLRERLNLDSYHGLDSAICSTARDIVFNRHEHPGIFEQCEQRLARLEDKVDRLVEMLGGHQKAAPDANVTTRARKRWNKATTLVGVRCFSPKSKNDNP
ncbi:transient receptor potential cation channel protein painless-like [Toxorhynchites rutilus septentrionalis]|uniref:transient receptor potential cation channel protein painless-like n=1 Tax=Toxorhynchites rutilus septentrionalis TaxID=329112 RepID=UPI002478381E|nr:transient receptor potential cation channel protein painless-like [Toxorhynchites rutilus septentrionalis]